MRRLILTLALVLLPVAGHPQALEQRISDELDAQGFAVTAMYRTWLGRLRVIAQSDSLYRELVFDPATGELLQDYVDRLADRERRLATNDDDDRRDDSRWADVVAEPELGVMVEVPEIASVAGSPPGDVTSASEGGVAAPGGTGE